MAAIFGVFQMFGIRLSGLSLVFLIAVVCFTLPASAEENTPRFVRVPIFFVTDRNLQATDAQVGAQFGPHRKYIGECQHDPYMGSGYCVVENKSNKPLTETLKKLGWSAAADKEKLGAYKINRIESKDFSQIENQFYSQVAGSALKSDHKNIVLFAHGYKNSFESAWHTAANFSYCYEAPVVLYSWPSVAKLRSYSSDENNNEWSQEHFNDVLTKMEELCANNPNVKLRVFAHSMGSRLVIRGTPFLREKPHVVEMAVVCPDIDQGLVKHYARRYLSTKGTAKIRLYMSRRDKALAFSQILHGGYCRLGECADSLASLVPGLQAKAADSEQSKADELEFKERIEKTKHRMQTIDFTSLDSGAIGHHIPYELMESMSFENVPGQGLQLVIEQSGERSGISKALSKMTKLKTESVTSPESCFRVVKVDEKKKTASK